MKLSSSHEPPRAWGCANGLRFRWRWRKARIDREGTSGRRWRRPRHGPRGEATASGGRRYRSGDFRRLAATDKCKIRRQAK